MRPTSDINFSNTREESDININLEEPSIYEIERALRKLKNNRRVGVDKFLMNFVSIGGLDSSYTL